MRDTLLKIGLAILAINVCSVVVFAQSNALQLPALDKQKLPVLFLHKGERMPKKRALVFLKINTQGEVTEVTIPKEKCPKTRLHKFTREFRFIPATNEQTVQVNIAIQSISKSNRNVWVQIEPYNFRFKAKVERYDPLVHEDCFPPEIKISFGKITRAQ